MHSLISALDGGVLPASRPGRFILRERAPGTHWIGGWVGPRAGLVSWSVRLGLEPLIVTHGHVSAWKKISVLFFVGRGCHVQVSQSLSVLRVCSYSCEFRSRFDIIIVITVSSTNIMYKSICTCQACQSGHCTADYANYTDGSLVSILITRFNQFIYTALIYL
jgi:hypothetical protein